MGINEVREYAKTLGLQPASKFIKLDDLVHAIQLAEGKNNCFREIANCALVDCRWYVDCVRSNQKYDGATV